MDSLLIWNWILFIIHSLLAIGILIYFKTRSTDRDDSDNSNINFSLYDFDIKYDSDRKETVTAKEVVTVKQENIEYMIVLFFAITAVFHLFYATNGFGSGLYLQMIKENNNYFRWIEYSISATIMIIIINLISGVKSLNASVIAAVANFAVMLQGNAVETSLKRKDGNKDYIIPTITGWVLLAVVFFVVVRTFFLRLAEVRDSGFEVPSWLPAIIFPIIIWFLSFGLVQLHQIIFKSDYRKYEYAYLILSLTSKAFLGLYLAYGLTQRNDNEDIN